MTLNTLLSLFKRTKALLVGDIMLDRYVFGKISRISPEAPVPVFLSNSNKEVLGGSGNVLSNLVALGVQTTYLTVVGKDHSTKKINKLLKGLSLRNKPYLFQENNRKTTTKTRYLSNNQQIIRIDEEKLENILKKTENEIIKKVRLFLKGKDVMIISDYNKGLVTNKLCQFLIKEAKSLKIPIIVDPKNNDFNIYRNATIITPNQLEASKVSQLNCNDDIQAEACGKVILKKYNINKVLITRGDKGLSLVSNKKTIHSPTISKEVYDVSGAGDTVLAVVSACLPNKVEDEKILKLANKAAGNVVGKIGTSPVSIKELFGNDKSEEKILDIKSLSKKIKIDKSKGLKIGFTNGCFDILHYGHISYIEKSRLLCDKLIIAINSDKSVKLLKGKDRPINDQLKRAKVLASLQFCDYVTVFNEETPLSIIKKIKPHILTKGGDYLNKEIVGEKEIKKWGGEVLILDFINELSSTKLIKKLRL